MTDTKIQIFEHLAELARALGHASRLELLDYIAQGERPVERLAELSGMSVANTSAHLKQLRQGRFVRTRRDGKRVLYRLADGPVLDIISAMHRYAENNRAEMREIVTDYFEARDSLEPVSREELLTRLKEDDVILLDVRPDDEFTLGHIPGAINIPFAELERRFVDLPKEKEIIAYCRGPYCVLSFEAVAALRAKGYKIRRLEDGFPEWKAAGLAVTANL